MRDYYSSRSGANRTQNYDLKILLRLFFDLFNDLVQDGYFQEYFGYECVDSNPDIGFTPGKFGPKIDAKVFRLLKKDLWPIDIKYKSYNEEDLFDMIEVLFDYISEPVNKGHEYYFHSFMDCGFHYKDFDVLKGQEKLLREINDILSGYQGDFVLSSSGLILHKVKPGLEKLTSADLPNTIRGNLRTKIENAINRFLTFRSSLEERTIATRELADILESIRPEAKKVIANSDESDLFNLANNFGIRHYNDKQKNNYDKAIWLSWIFYYYLATIHACLRLIEKNKEIRKLRKDDLGRNR